MCVCKYMYVLWGGATVILEPSNIKSLKFKL